MHIAPSGSGAHLAHREVGHTPTYTLAAHLLLRSNRAKQRPDTPAHSYTNKQTHLLLLTIGRRREGEQNKQFNLHDSGLLYISRLRQ